MKFFQVTFLAIACVCAALARPQEISLQVEPQHPALHNQQQPAISPPRPQVLLPSKVNQPGGPQTLPATKPEPVAPLGEASEVDAVTETSPASHGAASETTTAKYHILPVADASLHVEPEREVFEVNTNTKETKKPNACPRLYLPVCANNGKTFNSECELRSAALSDSSLKKVKDGQC